jgi:hypothetical protein
MTTIKKAVAVAVPSSVPSTTGTGAGSAGNTTGTSSGTSAIPATGFELQLQQMLQGFQTYVPAGFTFSSVSGGYSQATVVSELTQMLALYTAADQAKAAASAAVKQRAAATPSARSYFKAVKAMVVAYYGKGNPALANFGIVQKVAAARTPIEKAVSAAKVRQTRAANGTLGKRQKAKIALAQEVQSVAANLAPQGPQVAQTTATPPAATAPAAAVKPPVSG